MQNGSAEGTEAAGSLRGQGPLSGHTEEAGGTVGDGAQCNRAFASCLCTTMTPVLTHTACATFDLPRGQGGPAQKGTFQFSCR